MTIIAPRPQYETESDYEAGVRLGRIFGKRAKPPAEFVPIQGRDEGKSHIDGAYLRDGFMVGFGECKQRTCTYGQYPDYRIGERKVLEARTLHEILRVPVFLVVGFSCGTVVALNVQKIPYQKIECFGRYDRGDIYDTEPGAVYAWKDFLMVKLP